MKTLIKKALTLVIAVSSLFATAYASTPYIKMKSYDEKKFSLIVSGLDASEMIRISLKDNNDFEFYSERLNVKKGYGKKFDLQSLPDGEYFLELENDTAIRIFTLSISEGQLVIMKDDQKVIHKPSIRQEGNKVDVSMQNPKTGKLELSILNKTDELIYKDTISENGDTTKRYDMSHLHPGDYTMKIRIDGWNFSQSLNVK